MDGFIYIKVFIEFDVYIFYSGDIFNITIV